MGEAMENEQKLVATLKHNYTAEMEGAVTYRAVADLERDPAKAEIIRKLASVEEEHAQRWANYLNELGETPPPGPFKPRQSVLLTARAGSVQMALRKLEATEQAHVKEYSEQARELGDPKTTEIAEDLAKDESEHAEELQNIIGPPVEPQKRLDSILRGEKHVATGSWIGDAIYGVNDGLGAVFGIVSGVSGATGGSHFVLIAGLMGMVASAVSMGSGAYLAAKSEAEVRQAELERERREIEEDPDEEKKELALFYEMKGLTESEAGFLVDRIAQDPERMLQSLAQEELGISEQHAPNQWQAAITASTSTALGAFIPVIPFFFMEGYTAVIWAVGISLAAHFAVGAAKSLITTRSWWTSGLEMTVVGILAGIVTFGVGLLAEPLTK